MIATSRRPRPVLDGLAAEHPGSLADDAPSRAGRALAGQNQVLRLLAVGSPLERILDALCRHLESLIDGAACSILLVDEAGRRLCSGRGPSLPAAFMAAIDGLEIGPCAGACGTAAYRRQTVVVEDTATDPLCAGFRHLVARHGLRACWSVPIPDVETDRVVGTFAVYHPMPRRPSQADLDAVEEAGYLAGLAINIKRTEDRLRRAEARYRGLVEHLPAVTYVEEVGPTGDTVVTYISPQIEKVLGYTPEDYLADPGLWLRLLHPDDRDRVLAEDAQTKATGEPFDVEYRQVARDVEYRQVARDGRVVWVRDVAVLIEDGDGSRARQGVRLDITARREAEERLQRLAYHDALTGLPNRALVMDRLREALAEPGLGGAVLFLDLDGFKAVNDRIGHAAGDELLVAVGRRLLSGLRPGATLARFGGDEFVVLLEDVTDAGVPYRDAERLLRTLRAPFVVGGYEAFIGGSIGIALAGPALADPAELLRAADVALYRAKATEKGSVVVYDPGVDAPLLERREREGELRRALDRGEFRVVYQPVVNVANGALLGVEALVRWQHPAHGLLAPAEFLPVAEEAGLMVAIGRWVLTEACRQVRVWQTIHPGAARLHLSVNLSARQFRHPGLVSDITRILDETGFEPGSLSLEVAEGAAIADAAASAVTLRGLKRLGVAVTVDDFGTGYAALSSLTRFAVDHLKIDRSCVAGLGHRREETAAVRAMVGMAKAVGLNVMAEGVETAEQLALLRGLGCDQAQGHHFAPALPASEMGSLLERGCTGFAGPGERWVVEASP